MEIAKSFKVCGAALSVQRERMDVITSNLANADATRTAQGGPYRKKSVVLASEEVTDHFGDTLRETMKTVRVAEIVEDPSPPKMVHNPAHPDADAGGYVAMPNVHVATEMAELIVVGRAYEAVVTALDATKNMALKALEIGK